MLSQNTEVMHQSKILKPDGKSKVLAIHLKLFLYLQVSSVVNDDTPNHKRKIERVITRTNI